MGGAFPVLIEGQVLGYFFYFCLVRLQLSATHFVFFLSALDNLGLRRVGLAYTQDKCVSMIFIDFLDCRAGQNYLRAVDAGDARTVHTGELWGTIPGLHEYFRPQRRRRPVEPKRDGIQIGTRCSVQRWFRNFVNDDARDLYYSRNFMWISAPENSTREITRISPLRFWTRDQPLRRSDNHCSPSTGNPWRNQLRRIRY